MSKNLIIYLEPEYIEETPSIDVVQLPDNIPVEESVEKYITENYFPIAPGSFVISDPTCGTFATGGPDCDYDNEGDEEPYLSWWFEISDVKKM